MLNIHDRLNHIRHYVVLAMVGFVFVFVLEISLSSGVFAATVPGLSIYPLRTEPAIAPGSVYSGQFTISNTTIDSMDIHMTAEEFGVINQQYDYSFDPGSQLVDWVRFDPSIVTLEPGKSQSVAYKISVPNGAEPRGQYISLFATSQKKAQSNGIASQERVASLLYITVEGDVTRYGKIISLRNPWLMGGGDESKWTAQIQNTGSTHYRSVYSVTTETLFNTKLGTRSGSSLILPASIRLVQGTIKQPTFPGIYKIVYSIGLGDNPAASVTRYIVYLRPIDLIVLIAIAMLWIALMIRRFTRTKIAKRT